MALTIRYGSRTEILPTPLLFAAARGDTPLVGLRDRNPFASRSTITLAASLPTQGDIPRPTGSLIKEPGKVRNDLLDAQVSSLTDPAESAVKEQALGTPRDGVVGQMNANQRARNYSV